jgi:cellulose synthase/poly-beta-1,6-N-acetylglucosamine synthase-like glycosyltransferase
MKLNKDNSIISNKFERRGKKLHQYQIGLAASYIALTLGGFYFIYAIKYYASSLVALTLYSLDQDKLPPEHSLHRILAKRDSEHITLGDEPWVSIHLPFFNELNVARRILEACMDINYTNYEVLLADDSRDTTIEILREHGWRHGNPIINFARAEPCGKQLSTCTR